MPIEDVDYLKKNSQKQSYIFLVNSKDRNKLAYPTPSEYIVEFSQPFFNVIGLNVLDASIPRTMYNIDEYNNTLYYFIYSSNFDLNQLSSDSFFKTTIDPGDYTVQTLLNTLNLSLNMPLNSNLSNSNVSITTSTLSNPPDIKNRLQFDCPYPFILDMKRSTISESLGFDTYIQDSERTKTDLNKNYTGFIYDQLVTDNTLISIYRDFKKGLSRELIINSLPPPYETAVLLTNKVEPFATNYQLYQSVDLPFTEAQGTTVTIFEGPRSVIRSIPLTNKVAQRFYVPNKTYLTRVYSAFYTSELSTSSIVDFTIQTEVNNQPSGVPISQTESIAISFTDGTLSDSSILSIPLEGETYYWIVFDQLPNATMYYNDVLETTTTLKSFNGSIWESIDDLENDVYYQVSIRIEITNEYHRIKAPGIYSLIGEPYIVIRCKEIEENSYRSLAYTNHQLGIAKIKLGVVGYREERIDFSSIPNREFHPVGRLTRLTLRFETGDGRLYDFKGVNHNITFGIQYYEPIMKQTFERSIINTNYTGDFMGYMYQQADQEEDSDDEEVDYNRDTMDKYRMAESRNLPWQVAQRNVQQYYDLNIQEDDIVNSQEKLESEDTEED